ICTLQRQVRCEFTGTGVQLVYDVVGGNAEFTGELKCHPLGNPIFQEIPCPYECGQYSQCIEFQMKCACLTGYIDMSSLQGKEVGSLCTKCNNSDPQGTDYVMLFHESDSITEENRKKMVNFVSTFLKFIDLDHSDN
ncbi:hypothetical protein PMAYCL1PPCAC_27695, partial [Pristionchus mayeri]